LKNTYENNARPAHDTAKSALSKALDNLAKEQTALSAAQADLDSFNEKIDSATTLPKNAAHDGAEREGAVTFCAKRVERATGSVAEARAEFDRAEVALTEAQVLDRAEAVAAFDDDEWAAEFAAEAQAIADKYLGQLYEVNELEAEAIRLGKSIGLDSIAQNPDSRVRVQNGSGGPLLTLDGQGVSPAIPSTGLDALRESIRDSRYDAELEAEVKREREERAALEAERKAERGRYEAYRQAERNGKLPFAYTGDTGGRPMITTNQYGEPLRKMTTTPDGVSTVAAR
jgi:hypothetical protein